VHTRSPDVQAQTESAELTQDLSGVCVGGSYLLLEPISSGATGTVWRALDHNTGSTVAVKLLREDLMHQPKAVTRFVQEHAILLMLRHPNIVRVRDLLTVGPSLGLVMDLIEGGSLRDYLDDRGPLAPAEAATLLSQVAAALAEAHKAGVVHRDLKPDNVLLDRSGPRTAARLTDFGIARTLDAPGLTTPDALVGTPSYMAPEVICGSRPSPAVDVYAFGVLLYELVAGRQPYGTGSALAILRRQVDSSPQPVPGMPDTVWRVVQACMDKRPRRRPSAHELITTMRSLARVTAAVPALGPPAEPTENDPDPAHPAAATVIPAPRRPTEASLVSWWTQRPWGHATLLILVLVATLVVVGLPGLRRLDTTSPGDFSGTPDAPSTKDANRAAPTPQPQPGSPSASAATGGLSAPTISAQPDPTARIGLPGAAIEASLYGPYECPDQYVWDPGHPVLAKPCHAISVNARGGVRLLGRMQALPGVQADVVLTLEDADTGETVNGPYRCRGLMFTDFAPEHNCGPFEITPVRGRRYLIIQQWNYTGRGILPGGTVRGTAFTW
jgi:serine/threonine-protein kinase